jgi:Domain of unknown function (DUF3597)
MGFFDKIRTAIFGRAEAAPSEASKPSQPTSGSPAAPPASRSAPDTPGSSTSAPPPAVRPAGDGAVQQTQNTQATAPGRNTTGAASQVDVAAILTDLASKRKEKLDWRKSIVDLMKLLDLDSSLSARKELAKELSYSGDTNDSASMNMWLHKQVMRKLAENGGNVPDDLKD